MRGERTRVDEAKAGFEHTLATTALNVRPKVLSVGDSKGENVRYDAICDLCGSLSRGNAEKIGRETRSPHAARRQASSNVGARDECCGYCCC